MSLNFLISSLYYTTGKLELVLASVGLQVVSAIQVFNNHIYLKASLTRFCAVVVFLGYLLLVCLVYESQMQIIICVLKNVLTETRFLLLLLFLFIAKLGLKVV